MNRRKLFDGPGLCLILFSSFFILNTSAFADSFKCGVEAVNALAALSDPAAPGSAAQGALEKLLAEIKEDDFETDKAREVALNKVREMLSKADYKLPEDTSKPSEVFAILADDAELPEVAYAILMQRENAKVIASRDPQGVRAWLYGTVAGIQKGFDGTWDDIELAPIPDPRISFVDASVDTKNGPIKSAWKYEGGKCRWKFTIPAGAKATVCVNGMCARYEPGEHSLEIKK